MRKIPLVFAFTLLGTASHAVSWDVAPPNPAEAAATAPQYCPKGDGRVTSADALVVLRRGLGLISGFSCFGEPISDSIVDVSPPASGNQNTFPPYFVAGGNGSVNSADALFLLRSSVGLIELIARPRRG